VLGFNQKVFYETGINMVNSQKQPGIQTIFLWETTWYSKC